MAGFFVLKGKSPMQKPDLEKVEKFFYYINERERVRLKRRDGLPKPWTEDPIIKNYRFTNVKREYDITTRYFKEIYDLHSQDSSDTILLNCAIYRYFGTIGFAKALGWVTEFDGDKIINTAKTRSQSGETVFTGAYVITNQGIKAPKENVVVEYFITGFYENLPKLVKVIEETNSWKEAMTCLREVTGFGGTGFMAKEVLLDAMLTPVLREARDKQTWSPCGPGARKGLNLLWDRDASKTLSEDQCLDEMRYLFGIRNEYLEYFVAPKINCLHDMQWNLCEISKYLTIANGGRGKRKYNG